MTRAVAAALAWAVLARVPAQAAAPALPQIDVDPASGVALRLTCPFWEPPVKGFLPLEVEVRNDTGEPGTWDLFFRSNVYQQNRESRHTLRVEAGATRQFDLMVPLVPGLPAYNTVTVSARGPGVPGPASTTLYQRYLGGRSGHTRTAACTAMSESLAIRSWGEIAAELDAAHSANACGSQFDPKALPSDWRGYTGFDIVFMTDEEWRDVAPASRAALREWIALGGRLRLASAAKGSLDVERHGFGSVAGALVSARALDAAVVAETILDIPAETDDYTAWGDARSPGRPSLPVWPLASVILGFAALVGPLNLFVLCRGTRRYRLYWTTPLLSLAASILLAAFILYADGTGGTGQRTTTILLVPAENQEVLLQEQVVRTGLLLNARFQAPEPVALRRLSYGDGTNTAITLGNDGSSYYGGWFSSRSVQAHLALAVRSTRARVERVDDHSGVPELLSSLPAAMDELLYVDGDGRYWQARHVRQGIRVRLTPASEPEWSAWWKREFLNAGPYVQDRLRRLDIDSLATRSPGGFFCAQASGLAAAVETHPRIRWSDERTIVLGPVL